MEDCSASHLIFDMKYLLFCSQADWNISKVEHFFNKCTFSFIDNSLALNINIVTIFDLEDKKFLLTSLACRLECDFHNFGRACSYCVNNWIRDEGVALGNKPFVSSASISMVANHQLLCDTHIHIFFRKFKSEDFFGNIKNNWVSLSLNEEIERSIVDVVGNWSTECLCSLAAKYNIKACFLPWWDHLRKWGTLLELWILINENSNINVLSQVVSDNEALCSR
jgi:hypothetical protein